MLITQLLFWFYLILPNFIENQITPSLNAQLLLLFTFMTVLIAGAGYVINDIVDIAADQINKGEKLIVSKSISKKHANIYYLILSIVALFIAVYLTSVTGQFNFLMVFAITTLVLYFYSKRLKSSILFGNIVVSLLIALVPFVFIFVESESFNLLKSQNQEAYISTFSILVSFTIFAFISNLVRELLKDCEDIIGDQQANLTTLATAFGSKKVEKIAMILCLILIGLCLVWAINIKIWNSLIEIAFFLVGLIAPIIFIILNLRKDDQSKAKYQFLSRSLKILMASGLFYLFLHLNG